MVGVGAVVDVGCGSGVLVSTIIGGEVGSIVGVSVMIGTAVTACPLSCCSFAGGGSMLFVERLHPKAERTIAARIKKARGFVGFILTP
jgi:hypothetical protein